MNEIFSNLANRWMLDKKMYFKESTIIKYQNVIRLYLMPEFGKCPLKDLSAARINEFGTKLLLNGGQKEKGLSPKTVTDILTLLNNMIRYAQNCGFLIPVTDITMPMKRYKKRVPIFSIVEQKKL